MIFYSTFKDTIAIGEVRLNGNQPGDLTCRTQIGVSPQVSEFPPYLTVQETLNFVEAHYPKTSSIREIISKFTLTPLLNSRTNILSTGQKQKLALALAFIGNPNIVFLDEPTAGLDIKTRHRTWNMINEYKNNNKTVFFTTHHLEEAELLANRIIYLKDGKLSEELK